MDAELLKKILIIDDEPKIRKVIVSQIKSGGKCAFEASNRHEAFKIIASENIDIVICDIKLEDDNGIEILREIRKSNPDLPVIMLTGYIDSENIDLSRKIGCTDILLKPVRKEKLIESIDKALGKAIGENP